jgi:hypothetical protein
LGLVREAIDDVAGDGSARETLLEHARNLLEGGAEAIGRKGRRRRAGLQRGRGSLPVRRFLTERERLCGEVLADFVARQAAQQDDVQKFRRLLAEPTTAGRDRFREELAGRLAKRYRWTQDDAERFLLAGSTPALPPLHVQCGAYVSRGPEFQLTVAPWISPTTLRRLFRHYQRRLYASSKNRNRLPHPRQLEVVRFVSQFGKRPSWDALTQAWNRRHPSWAYGDRSAFRRAFVAGARVFLNWRAVFNLYEQSSRGTRHRR